MDYGISQRKPQAGGPFPSPSTMQPGSPTLHQLAHGTPPRGHLVQTLASWQAYRKSLPPPLMVHSMSEEHLLGAQAQPSLRHNESGKETKQDGRALELGRGSYGSLEMGPGTGQRVRRI